MATLKTVEFTTKDNKNYTFVGSAVTPTTTLIRIYCEDNNIDMYKVVYYHASTPF